MRRGEGGAVIFRVFGVDVRCRIAPDGHRVVDAQSTQALIDAIGSDAEPGEIEALADWQRGSAPPAAAAPPSPTFTAVPPPPIAFTSAPPQPALSPVLEEATPVLPPLPQPEGGEERGWRKRFIRR